MKKVLVNNCDVVTNGFRGINFIHQLYNYMPDDCKRLNTPELIELEHKTLKKMGVKQVRSFYGSSLSWDAEKGVHNFENEWMQAFYKNCKDMEKLGIEVGITPQWNMKGLFKKAADGHSGVHLHYNGCLVEGDLETTAKNFEKFIEESVLAFERHGVTNVKYLYCFTECNNSFTDSMPNIRLKRQYDKLIPLYDRFVRAVDQGLKNAGMRDRYKIVGPCDNWRADDGSEPYSILTKYIAENLADVVDIIGAHNGYDRGVSYSNEDFYDIPFPKLTDPKVRAEALGKEYWVDEWNVELHSSYSAKQKIATYSDPMRGVAFGAMVNSLMNMGGIHNVLIWALYSQQWPNNHCGGDGSASEFIDGVQRIGYIQNLCQGTTPTKAWYAVSMLTRFVGSGKVYGSSIARPIYASAIDRDDGEFTVVVTSYSKEPVEIEVQFAKSLEGKTLYRYLYNPQTVTATPEANMIKSDLVKEGVTEAFTDSLPGCCVVVYTTEKTD